MNIKDLRTFRSKLECEIEELAASRMREEISFIYHTAMVKELTEIISATETLIEYLK